MSVFEGFWGTGRDLRVMKEAQNKADEGVPTELLFNGRYYPLQPREQAVNEVLHRIEAVSSEEGCDGIR